MRRPPSVASVARAQAVFNVLGGAWPIVSLRTFERVYGKKNDVYLQKTVGGLLFSIRCNSLSTARTDEAT